MLNSVKCNISQLCMMLMLVFFNVRLIFLMLLTDKQKYVLKSPSKALLDKNCKYLESWVFLSLKVGFSKYNLKNLFEKCEKMKKVNIYSFYQRVYVMVVSERISFYIYVKPKKWGARLKFVSISQFWRTPNYRTTLLPCWPFGAGKIWPLAWCWCRSSSSSLTVILLGTEKCIQVIWGGLKISEEE